MGEQILSAFLGLQFTVYLFITSPNSLAKPESVCKPLGRYGSIRAHWYSCIPGFHWCSVREIQQFHIIGSRDLGHLLYICLRLTISPVQGSWSYPPGLNGPCNTPTYYKLIGRPRLEKGPLQFMTVRPLTSK